MARIYTRGGDGGETSLFDGSRTSKGDPRVDLYGDVDELNSLLGCAAASLDHHIGEPGHELAGQIRMVQRDLFEIGAILANPGQSQQLVDDQEAGPALDAAMLEQAIDLHQQELPALTSFILPGGSEPASWLHLGRTVCRRVERRAVEMASRAPLTTRIIVYLNRLSDFLFVAARRANHLIGVTDVEWTTDAGSGKETAP